MAEGEFNQNLEKTLSEMEIDGNFKKAAEAPPAPESAPEKALERVRPAFEIKEEVVRPPVMPKKPLPASAQTVAEPLPKSQLQHQVEGVLEEGMASVYLKLSPEKRAEFKKAGEETALKITKMLQQAVLKIKEVFHLIFKWLKIIPGASKYFLEQEAKIKSDRILALKKRMEKK